jgi:hypothetical protein
MRSLPEEAATYPRKATMQELQLYDITISQVDKANTNGVTEDIDLNDRSEGVEERSFYLVLVLCKRDFWKITPPAPSCSMAIIPAMVKQRREMPV